MLIWFLSSLSAAAPLDDDVGRAWYLWETGRDAEAQALADELWRGNSDAPAVVELYAATQVVAGRGASLEAEFRERLARDTSDAMARVALAWAISYRHPEPGPWCDEVDGLVGSVLDGEAHAWATLAEREAEYRCEGSTDHANAELIRLSVDPQSPAWVEGVLAKADAGYIRTTDAEALEQVWNLQPGRVDRAAVLWSERASGPARRRARRDAKQALAFAAESAEPSWVWSALNAYRELKWDKDLEEVKARLARMDPEAELDLERDRHTISDPPEYVAIDVCFDLDTETEIRGCADTFGEPENPAIDAYLHYRRYLALRAFGEPRPALTEALATFRADPTVVSYARTVVAAALDVPPGDVDDESASTILEALDVLLAEEPDVEQMGTTVARRWGRDLLLAARFAERNGDPSRAADLYLKSFGYDPSPSRRLELGRALADSRQPGAAMLHLTRGLVEAMDSPDLIRAARQRLDALAVQWGRRDANQVLQEAIGAGGPESPLMGEVLEAGTWGWPEDDGSPTVRLVVLWGELFEERGSGRYEALKTVATYAEQNDDVSAFAADIGVRRARLPEEIGLENVAVGPLTVQSLQVVAVPTVLVLDGAYRLRAVISPFTDEPETDEALVEAVDAVRAGATD